ncbi:MAG: DUF3800 domain-containing protein [Rhizomicrobium sp.]|jgi:hypothetical protein
MSADPYNPDFEYIAYIDEAGETGLKRILSIDEHGSAEWFVLSLVLIAKPILPAVTSWISEMVQDTGSAALKHLHFRRLPDHWKDYATKYIAEKPIKAFVICSNKKNMRRYRNVRAERMAVKDWYYCWLTRLALERASHFVWRRSVQKFGAPKRMKVIFGERGGLRVGQIGAYYHWIKQQSLNDNLYIPWGDIEWETIHELLLDKDYNSNLDGLKIADVVASAFFCACDNQQSGPCQPEFAANLKPVMACFPHNDTGRYSGYGVKLLPKWSEAKLGIAQQAIFRRYGYPLQLWQQKRNWELPLSPWREK